MFFPTKEDFQIMTKCSVIKFPHNVGILCVFFCYNLGKLENPGFPPNMKTFLEYFWCFRPVFLDFPTKFLPVRLLYNDFAHEYSYSSDF